ncbi:hypothetical protein PRUPE_3G142600 [Prunus persica]|uniref:Uncharacterized protein n=1 Tax=Prunus persica TaxID=3760 RepID=A0A251Q0B7_PRUPE|nr:hypothetical protein PRUPE_3G142600 [Prunus persica]
MHVRLLAAYPSDFFFFPVTLISCESRLSPLFYSAFFSLFYFLKTLRGCVRRLSLSLSTYLIFNSTSDLSVKTSASARRSFIDLSSARHAQHIPDQF